MRLGTALPADITFDLESNRCPNCRLRKLACFCESWPLIDSALKLDILVHEKELNKESNTALLIWKSLPNSRMFFWQRKLMASCTHDDAIDVDDINNKGSISEPLPVLLFPARFANRYQGQDSTSHPMLSLEQLKGRRLLLLDGSWQQVRKMYRQSKALQFLPCFELPISTDFPMEAFSLRRNQQEGGFCSAQAIALLHWHMAEKKQAKQMLKAFNQFGRHVAASRNNHAVKTELKHYERNNAKLLS
ncbi:tRNA-uridine aminocarboxypropyltransferase [uncultured Pseudoteredinibacter sp.]|uniref:DTW domain-containing protein n=1 Tax=uncultured Pseudoteredinibacter sp. TaxID=1641701 RepID=UPI0026078D49|nr:tRNA-uridine aminocarboxypropyltransferase [uncultured Pseudoteredinibacter sp.]